MKTLCTANILIPVFRRAMTLQCVPKKNMWLRLWW